MNWRLMNPWSFLHDFEAWFEFERQRAFDGEDEMLRRAINNRILGLPPKQWFEKR